MKKSFLNAALFLSLTAAFSSTAISCSNSDDDSTDNPSSSIDPANFQGTIASGTNVTLDPSKTYTLTGKLLVESGATLNIPAGTHIQGAQGATYIIVDRGGKININGTATNPVLFDGVTHGQGMWGGLVILGNAPSNRSQAGTSTSELGDMTYGGTNNADNSGSIKYVIIKDSGFKYNPQKEFNGLSLFGVGSGTQISYVFVTDGADDGVECFGGSPNVDHIVVTGVQDDGLDWTEGYKGTADYVYVARKTQYKDATYPGNKGIEADTQDTNPNTTFGNGASNPTITHATFIGNYKTGDDPSLGINLRAGSNGTFDNIVIANYTTGFGFETDRTLAWFQSASYIKNVKFVNVTTKSTGKNTAGTAVDMSGAYVENAAATGAGSGTALPDWAKGWTGLTSYDIADAGN